MICDILNYEFLDLNEFLEQEDMLECIYIRGVHGLSYTLHDFT
jgi:hypothetical protein